MPAAASTSEPIFHQDDGQRLRANLFVLITAQGVYVLMASIDLTLTGLVVGAVFAAVGGLVPVWAVATHDFLLFCAGTALVGAYQGFAVYYRYAAADDAPPERRPRVISYVVGAGVVAAVGGPFIAIGSRHLLAATYAGSYAVISLLALATIVVLLPLRMPTARGRERDERGAVEGASASRRPLRAVLTQGVFLVGVA